MRKTDRDAAGREARLAHILQEIERARFVSLRALTERFGTTMQTARRDIALLERQQRVSKVHGGAVARETPDALSVEERLGLRHGEKKRIAEVAAALVEDDDVIFLDGGSTTAFLAPLLVERRIHVVTNAVSLVPLLRRGWPGLEVSLTGGCYYPGSELLLGPAALQTLRGIRVHKAFLSAAGVTVDGVYNANPLVVELEQAVIAQSAQTCLLVDSTKLGRTSLMRVCGLEGIHALVTPGPVPAAFARAARTAGCRILKGA